MLQNIPKMKIPTLFFAVLSVVFSSPVFARQEAPPFEQPLSRKEWKIIELRFERDYRLSSLPESLNAIESVVSSDRYDGIPLLAGKLEALSPDLHLWERDLRASKIKMEELKKRHQRKPEDGEKRREFRKARADFEEKMSQVKRMKEIREALISGLLRLLVAQKAERQARGIRHFKKYVSGEKPWEVRVTFFEILGRLVTRENTGLFVYFEGRLRQSVHRMKILEADREKKHRALLKEEKRNDQSGRYARSREGSYKEKKAQLDEALGKIIGEVHVQRRLLGVTGTAAFFLDETRIEKMIHNTFREARLTGDYSLREILFDLISHIRHPLSKNVLREQLEREKVPIFKVILIKGLAKLKDNLATDLFLRELQSKEWQVRAAAIHALGLVPSRKAVLPLIEALSRERGRLRGDIEDVLVLLTGETFHANVFLWRDWWRKNSETFVLAKKKEKEASSKSKGVPKTETSFYGIQTYSQNILFIIDVSGSMAEGGTEKATGRSKITIAKEEITRAIKGLKREGYFNIIFYEESVNLFSNKMVSASRENKEKTFKFIEEGLVPEGATNIYDALKKAFLIIEKNPRGRGYEPEADTIFFLSDGEPTHGETLDPEKIIDDITQRNRTLSVIIHTVGIGVEHNRSFMKALAEKNGGTYVSR